jgi:hypothetical protein
MNVRLLTSIVGPSGSWNEGDVYSCDEGTAQRLIERGYAVPVTIAGIELAVTTGAPERAMKPKGRKR